MTRIVVDTNMISQLGGLNQDSEVWNAQGEFLGRFLASTPNTDPEHWEWLTPEVSAEEIQRRINSGEPRYSTAEVLDKLRAL